MTRLGTSRRTVTDETFADFAQLVGLAELGAQYAIVHEGGIAFAAHSAAPA